MQILSLCVQLLLLVLDSRWKLSKHSTKHFLSDKINANTHIHTFATQIKFMSHAVSLHATFISNTCKIMCKNVYNLLIVTIFDFFLDYNSRLAFFALALVFDIYCGIVFRHVFINFCSIETNARFCWTF